VIHRLGAAALLIAALCPPAIAQTTDLAGAKFEPTATVAGAPLVLNGAGVRYKAVFKVYAAGLYLSSKANTPEAVLAAPGPKRVQVVMLREIDANELGKLFTRGMQDNAPRDEFVKCIPGTIRMGEIFAVKKKLLAGDTFSVDWQPGSGTVVRINGKAANEPIVEPEFYSGMLRIWLGKSPADLMLRDAMLGKAPVTTRLEH
jgi:hypothetical protein